MNGLRGSVSVSRLRENFGLPEAWPKPGTAITVTILAANLFGNALLDFLDPKLR
jgi:ABC-type dipeptide/oligopeptide/nickel transport system permease subunit